MNKLLEKAKPILFNTDMVQAILDGRKTETRRLIKPQPKHVQALTDGRFETSEDGGFDQDVKYIKPPYKPGDILYVRETWCTHEDMADVFEEQLIPGYYYKANEIGKEWVNDREIVKWRPAIHMPKDAARIFLRVVDVRVGRLQDITEDGAKAEGVVPFKKDPEDDCWSDGLYRTTFQYMWNEMYGWNPNSWDTNPWVWVIKFKRMEGLKDV